MAQVRNLLYNSSVCECFFSGPAWSSVRRSFGPVASIPTKVMRNRLLSRSLGVLAFLSIPVAGCYFSTALFWLLAVHTGIHLFPPLFLPGIPLVTGAILGGFLGIIWIASRATNRFCGSVKGRLVASIAAGAVEGLLLSFVHAVSWKYTAFPLVFFWNSVSDIILFSLIAGMIGPILFWLAGYLERSGSFGESG
jgi:hypothetical protein